jgi:hypothetical protein
MAAVGVVPSYAVLQHRCLKSKVTCDAKRFRTASSQL